MDANVKLYDRYMGGHHLTAAELNELAKWLIAQRDRAILLGDGNLAEWYGSILNGVLTVIAD